MIEINLLPPRNVQTHDQQTFQRKLMLGAIAVTGVMVFLFGTMFTVAWFLSNRENQEVKKRDNLLSDLKQKESEVRDIQLVKTRVQSIKLIREGAVDFQEPISEIYKLFENRAKISHMTINLERKVSLSASVPSAEEMSGLLTLLVSEEAGKLKQTKIGSLRMEASAYDFDMTSRYQDSDESIEETK